MKALTLTQPWATLVTIGAKQFETRSWGTSYRGPLGIHAAKGFPNDCRELCLEEPFRSTLVAAGINTLRDLPLGQMLATCNLVDCLRTEMVVEELQRTESLEYHFGNYGPHRYAFKLNNVQRLEAPIPVKGALGLWEWAVAVGVWVPQ